MTADAAVEPLTAADVRELLGAKADGKSDAELLALVEQFETLALVICRAYREARLQERR